MRTKVLFFALVILVISILIYVGVRFWAVDHTTFFIIEFLTVLVAVIFLVLYNKFIKPYHLLTNSIDLIKGQEFSSRLRPIHHSDVDKLIDTFNKMMEKLHNEQLSIREKNHFLDLLIQASPQGLIYLGFDDEITGVNPAGLRLLGIDKPEQITGKSLQDIPSDIGQKLAGLSTNQENIIRSKGVDRYRCSRHTFLDRGASRPFILIEELTHELLDAEKKSYNSLIRMMAHEVNNSVGAISSTLYVMLDIASQNEDSEIYEIVPAVKASLDRSLHLSTFVKNLAEVIKIPMPNKTKVNVHELLKTIAILMEQACRNRNIALQLQLRHDDIFINADVVQLEQVFLNIIKNAYEAIENDGTIVISTGHSPAFIEIKNNGSPLTPDIQEKLFTPFFTTKHNGQGIGLMLIREILHNHDYRFEFFSKDEWTKFIVYVN